MGDSSRTGRMRMIRHALICLFLAGLPLAAMSGIRLPDGTPKQTHGPTDRPLISQDHDLRVSPESLAREELRRLPEAPVSDQLWFVSARQQFRRLGATYVRLEKWHSEPSVYYFECQIPACGTTDSSKRPIRLAGLSSSAKTATLDVLRRARDLRPLSKKSRPNSVGTQANVLNSR